MTDRRGFALIAVLWVVTALAILVSSGLAYTAVGRAASENRSALRRSFWAAQACLAIARAEYADDPDAILQVDSTHLGRTTWCEAVDIDPTTRLFMPDADSADLAFVFTDPTMLASLLDWIDADDQPRPAGAEALFYGRSGREPPRNAPVQHVRELLRVRGFESLTEADLDAVLTFRGDGRVNPNGAADVVLRASGIVPPSRVGLLVQRRAQAPFRDPEHLATALGLSLGAAEFRDLTARTVFNHRRRVIRVRGHVGSGARTLSTTLVATAVALPERLAVLRVEVE